jgi:starch synthase
MPLRIVEIASEGVPFAKTGGLADVTGALSRALAQRGHEVHVVLPLYASIDRAQHGIRPAGEHVEAKLGAFTERFEVFTSGVPAEGRERVWLLAHEWFDRPGLYGDAASAYPDNHLRFGAFCKAALALTDRVCAAPDIVHLHDWQAALAAVELRAPGLGVPGFERTKVVFTVHNLSYSGAFPADGLAGLGLPAALFRPEALEFYGRGSMIKGGLVYADALTTVSPRYAREIQTEALGQGLHGVLRTRGDRLVGVLNGIDTETWDPARDPLIPANYSADALGGKIVCKERLQAELGLQRAPGAPLFGVVARLVAQKGLDLVAEVLPTLLAAGGQLALLGTGDPALEQHFSRIATAHPGRVAARLTFDEGLSHRIEAGSDAFLMPSRSEPCGLTQLHSLRYGAVPIVRAVGGLDDTVEELDSARGSGTGFKFGAPTGKALWAAVERALRAYQQPLVWTGLVRRGMRRDFSWGASAATYEALFARLAAPAAAPEPLQS